MFEHCKQGVAMSRDMIIKNACSLSCTLCEQPEQAKYSALHCWTTQYRLGYCMGTKELHKYPKELIADALNFTNATKQKLTEPHRLHDFILNIDKTPIFSCMEKAHTKGGRMVDMHKSADHTKRAMGAMTVMASGKLLSLQLIFKCAQWPHCCL